MATKAKTIKYLGANPTPVRIPKDDDEDSTPPSFAKTIAALEVDESTARVEQMDGEQSLQEFADNGPDRRQRLRNRIAPAVARASNTMGRKYTIEIADTIMPSGLIYTVAVITRLV